MYDIALIHRDLHVGDILHRDNVYITDVGICKHADYNKSERTKK